MNKRKKSGLTLAYQRKRGRMGNKFQKTTTPKEVGLRIADTVASFYASGVGSDFTFSFSFSLSFKFQLFEEKKLNN